MQVLLAFLRLGCTSFGGPIAHLGYFRAEFVEHRRWLTESTYAEVIALAQSMPGPASSQVGFAIGLLRAGWLGGLAAWIGFTLPSAVLMLVFAFGYGYPHGRIGDATLHGLQLVAVAVVAQAVVRMQRTLAPDALHLSIALLGTLIALFASPTYATVLAIAGGALAGLLLIRPKEEIHPKKEPAQDGPSFAPPISRPGAAVAAILFAILLATALLLSRSRILAVAVLAGLYRTGALVFGGGHVVLPLLDAAIVQRGWLVQSSFLAGYGAAQAVPGPLFSIAAYVGAAVRPNPQPLLLGVCALVALFLPGLLLMAAVLPFWSALRRRPLIGSLLRGVNASVVGVLAAALYRPLWTTTILTTTDFLIALAAFVLLIRFKV
ncbi:MAG TPA: chromate efflux transporter [Acidobacteriaceae bacterium]